MINNIRSAFINMLEASTWMDDVSKRLAIDKVSRKEKVIILKLSMILI